MSTELHSRVVRKKLHTIVTYPSRLLRPRSRGETTPANDHIVGPSSRHLCDGSAQPRPGFATRPPNTSYPPPVHEPLSLHASATIGSGSLPEPIANLSPQLRTTGIPDLDAAILLPATWSSLDRANDLLSLAQLTREEQRARKLHADRVLARMEKLSEAWKHEAAAADADFNRATGGVGAVFGMLRMAGLSVGPLHDSDPDERLFADTDGDLELETDNDVGSL
ncbi:hypothetical protein BV25DRAFT_1919284 [Artomyces pyxidatus]|uniref:Uncharacterized protein n=1 Tax=Artomyces pyxidatus TaxID=48021 RepID=A0ACB8SQB4_9AGAM|nr:hypothetical protein BV25DRAFT_1919284 [Artomyces pyxidatus]